MSYNKSMWIASKAGWFSIVRKVDKDKGDSRRPIQVRARDRRDLVSLQALVPEVRRNPIIETFKADYAWRICISQAQLGWVMAALANAVDYPNFKDEIKRTPVQTEKIGLYHQVWETMAGHQIYLCGDSDRRGEIPCA